MPFEVKKKEFIPTIGVVEFGSEPTLALGGEKVWPLYGFDGPIANPPRVGVEIPISGVAGWNEGLRDYYADCTDVTAMAAKAAAIDGTDFVCLTFEETGRGGESCNIEDDVALAKQVADVCTVPLCIAGSGNAARDEELFVALAEVLEGKNVLFLSATEDNYKAVGTGVALAWGQKFAAESAVDINLAKQLNLLLGQLGITRDKTVMNIGTAVAGYGFEYVASTMERIKSAALGQNDEALQIPIFTPVGPDAWGTKEALAEEKDYPHWGSREERGIHMEIVTAVACLASGSNAVVMRHPKAASTVANLIALLTRGGE